MFVFSSETHGWDGMCRCSITSPSPKECSTFSTILHSAMTSLTKRNAMTIRSMVARQLSVFKMPQKTHWTTVPPGYIKSAAMGSSPSKGSTIQRRSCVRGTLQDGMRPECFCRICMLLPHSAHCKNVSARMHVCMRLLWF